MRILSLSLFLGLLVPGMVSAGNTISGDYLESRTCDVYTGPCFANAEMDLAGKEALMAWKVDQGTWEGVEVDGLGVALVVTSDQTLGSDGIFAMKEGKTSAVLLVDEQASKAQETALMSFVKHTAGDLSENVVQVVRVPFSMKTDFLTASAEFKAGEVASIETRGMKKGDCVCTNETVYYQPLNEIENMVPAYSKTLSYQGTGLNSRWTSHNLRSSFIGTFRQ